MFKLIRFHLFTIILVGLGLGAQAQQLSSELRFQSDSFISPYYESSLAANYQFLKLNIKNEDAKKDLLIMDVRGLFSLSSSLLNSLNVPELYYKNASSDEKTNLLIGRKKWNWSQLDQRWDFGVWEPVYKWNPLSPENQGLTGLFWSREGDNFQLTLFASPIYLPSQGPQFEIDDNGKFVASNPWYQTPPKSIRFANATQATDIEYKIQKPTESQVVFHSSYAGQISFGQKLGPRVSVAHAYKPMNQLLLAYNGLANGSTDKIEVNVLPFVNYHSVSSIDLSYNQEKYRLNLSALKDRPSSPSEVGTQWTKPLVSEATLLSPSIDLDLNFATVVASYIRVEGGTVREEGALANPNQMTLNSVYRFKEAILLGLSTRFRFSKAKYLRTSLTTIQSQANQFQVLKWSNFFKLTSAWSLFGEVQLIKAEEQSLQNRNEVAQYANNDRIMVGAGYVF